jgi:hypothetical protein
MFLCFSADRSIYHSLGYGTILYFQAVMTFDMVSRSFPHCFYAKCGPILNAHTVYLAYVLHMLLAHCMFYRSPTRDDTAVTQPCYKRTYDCVIPGRWDFCWKYLGVLYCKQLFALISVYISQGDIEAAITAMKQSVLVSSQHQKRTSFMGSLSKVTSGVNYDEFTEGKDFIVLYICLSVHLSYCIILSSWFIKVVYTCWMITIKIDDNYGSGDSGLLFPWSFYVTFTSGQVW